MSEVSGQILRFFRDLARRHGFAYEELVAGLVDSTASGLLPTRLGWDAYVSMWNRIERFGLSTDDIEDSGRIAIQEALGTPLKTIARNFTSARSIYHAVVVWFGPSLFRNIAFSQEALSADTLRIAMEIEGMPCPAFFLSALGALRAIPSLLGQPDAVVVVAELAPRRAVFDITPPPALHLLARARRVIKTLTAESLVVEELSAQQRQLNESYAALLRSQRDFRRVIETIPDGVFIHREGTIVFANPAWGSCLGFAAPGDAIGRRVTDFVSPDDRAAVAAWIDAERPPQGTLPREFEFLRRDGSLVILELSPTQRVELSGAVGWLIAARDVTERKRAERALRAAEQENRALLESIPDLILRIGRDGAVRRSTNDAEAGAASVSPKLIASIQPALAGTLETRTLHVTEHVDEQQGRHFETRLAPLGDDDAIAIVRDITEKRKLELKLARTDRLVALGTLAAGVAHEISNPLTYVMVNLQTLLRDSPNELAQQALAGAERMHVVVNDLKRLSRADEGKVTPVDLRAALEWSLGVAEHQLRHHALIVKELGSAPPVLANEARLGQVFLNLLLNAAQSIPTGRANDNEIRVTTSTDDDGRAVVEIRDTGCGIAPADLDHIFDPFFTTKPIGVGTGLGLAICHGVVTDFKGVIEVESQVGRGSAFRVRIPGAGPRAATVRVPIPATEAPRTRILIIDDDVQVAKALGLMLKIHDVVITSSGHQALELLSHDRFDVVFCDMMMPELGGIEIYEAVQARWPGMESRIVFMTGGAFTTKAREFLGRVPNLRIDKPFNRAVINDAIRALIARDPH